MKIGLLIILIALLLLSMAVIVACQPVFVINPPASPADPFPSPSASSMSPIPENIVINGILLDPQGDPISGATVLIQATTYTTQTDAKGHFSLSVPEAGQTVPVSAWADGYYCAKLDVEIHPAYDVTLTMRRIQVEDNTEYEWISPVGDNSCYSCKPGLTQVWLDNDAHGRSATNIRYLTMYLGTDVHGNQSPLTRYIYNPDYGSFPQPPDLTKPYFGPGYVLDFPNSPGNCAACHNPGAAIDTPYATDPSTVSGVDTFGIHCDYCHKVADVTLDPKSGIPYPNRPGVLSQSILRPFTEDEDRYQLFFGSFIDDNVPMEDTYLPLIEQSQWCAPCHFGVFWDTVIYNSYGEWLESPYSDPETGMTCQACHMPSPTFLNGIALTNVAEGMGGIERDPLTIHAHTFPGASSHELLQNSVALSVQVDRHPSEVDVTVKIHNDQVGHDVPTDSPLRQMILIVQAADTNGLALTQLDGPILPEWVGEGDPSEGYYAGLPGQAYAKILQEVWTGISPSGSYWNPTRVVSDNRLAAYETDITQYTFKTADPGAVTVQVRLLYRRAFISLMDQKGWDVPDILMESVDRIVP